MYALRPCLLLAPLLGLLAACTTGGRATAPASPESRATPQAVSIIRTYGWDTAVDEPQAEWSPDDLRVLARMPGGFLIYSGDDGSTPPETYRSTTGRETWFPVWVNPNQVAFGPARNVEHLEDGRVVPEPGGLTLVTLGAKVHYAALAPVGFRPRVGDGELLAQSEDRILMILAKGGVSEFGRGFWAEPQRHGPGVAWQETPVLTPDWWTGRPALGSLTIRWRPGVVDALPHAIAPVWCPDGALLATVLHAEPPRDRPWWEAGTDVVIIDRPGAAPRVLAPDAIDAAPHPSAPLVAVGTADGHILLVARDGGARAILGEGYRPRWSADGQRLLVQRRHAEDPLADVHAPAATPMAEAPPAPAPTPPQGNVVTGSGGDADAPAVRNHLTVYVLAFGATASR